MEINSVILGDCIEVMQGIKDKSIDLILTSPLYNLGNNHHTGSKLIYPYEDDINETEYQELQLRFLNLCYCILKDDGSLLYNHKNRIKNGISITPYEWILKSDFIIKQEIVWKNGSQNFDKIRFYPMTERIYWLSKSPDTKLYNAINHHDLFNETEWKPQTTNNSHQRTFPVKLAEDLLKCFPDKQVILDPFAGSGTTAIAAIRQNRNYILIEKEPKYYDIINKRIDQELDKIKIEFND